MGVFVDYTDGFNLDNSFSNSLLNTDPSGPFSATQWTLNFSLSGTAGVIVLGGLSFANGGGANYTGTVKSFDLSFGGVHHYTLSNISVSLTAIVDAFQTHSPTALFNALYAGADTFDLDNADPDNGYALFGGGGKDTFQYRDGWCSSEGGVDGGAGVDTLILDGAYSGTILLKTGAQLSSNVNLVGVEKVQLGAGASYTIEHRGGVNYGLLTIDGSALRAGDEMIVRSPSSDKYGIYKILGGAGADALTGGANAAGDTLLGNGGGDTLAGDLGADTLSGGAGIDKLGGGGGGDVLDGGTGNDVLTGGAGSDVFVFSTALAANIDRLTDFSTIADSIRLENAIFKKLTATGTLDGDAFWKGAAAHDASDRIIYNASTGALSYDPDGSGVQGAIHFATLATGLNLTANDFSVI